MKSSVTKDGYHNYSFFMKYIWNITSGVELLIQQKAVGVFERFRNGNLDLAFGAEVLLYDWN